MAVPFVILGGGLQKTLSCFAQGFRLIEEDHWSQRAFGQFEQGATARFPAPAEPAVRLPFERLFASRVGHAPFGKRQNRGSHNGRDGALCARVELAYGLDRVTQQFDAYRPWGCG